LIKRIHSMAMVVAAGALLAVPAIGEAHHKPGHTKGGNGKSEARGKSCAKKPTVNKGFVVRGTLVSYTADDPATPANEASVEMTVTGANRHAKLSGELTDTNATKPGVQVAGGSYTVNGSADPFGVKLSGYETGEAPAAGDKVRIVGKVAVTRRKCAPSATTVADRYGAVNVRKVRIIDAD